ncbi:MAG: class I SAM-dependent methyltransferase [Paracoccaceae bacterium]
MSRYLDESATRRFYDRFGARLDRQAFYEDPALEKLVAVGDFSNARNVMEFGCGTGRFAERLLSREMPTSARYAGCDLSQTMVSLTQARLAEYSGRTTIWQNPGRPDFDPAHPPFDRIVSTFVLDLLAPDAIAAFLRESWRTLKSGGYLCLVNLTFGARPLSRLTSTIWGGIANINPRLVGGCHPVRIAGRLDQERWKIRHHSTKSAWSVPFEVTVAERH